MTIRHFRKKPITIAAVQWTGDNADELVEFTGGRFRALSPGGAITAEVFDDLHATWVGVMTDQWVIRGVKGEFYPCDPDVLAETYDEATD